MYHLNKRNFLFALHFCSSFFPQETSGDQFTTTECHCFGVYDEIPDNYGLLSMSYYSSPAKTKGYLDIPCPKEGCEPRKGASRILCGRAAHREPGGHEGDEAAFPKQAGFCYRIRKGKKDEVLFPVKGEAGTLMEREENADHGQDHDGEDYIEGADIEAQEDHQDEEYEEESSTSDALPNTTSTSSSTPLSSTSTPNDTSGTNWQPLSHKTTRRLNNKSACVEICSRYYGHAIPDCGTYVLPGPGRGRAKTMTWQNKCKKTSWRKIPDVAAWER